MTLNGWLQIALFCAIIAALTKPLGAYLTRVLEGTRALAPLERPLYRLAGIDPRAEQSWLGYALAMLAFNLAGFLVLYALQRLQAGLPLNPAGFGAVPPELAFNTAVSFVTNTNWQNYGGETTMAHLTQMAGLTVQNFVSAATGIAVAVAVIRGFARASAQERRQLLGRPDPHHPLRAAAHLRRHRARPDLAGMPQTLAASVDATTLEGARQTIATGPVASQVAIKMLGTNGGGFFNVNAAHPFENPTAVANLLQMVAIFALGAALTNVFGRMVGDERQGWAILAAMGVLFIAGVGVTYWAEANGNPLVHALGVDGANMEGKEVRFGPALSALFAVITTAASCGAVNAMHDSFMPLGGHDPARQHAARRDHRRRRRRRPLRHADLRARRDLHRRADGRPHAGVRRQEDRGARGQARHARDPVAAARDARLHRRRRGAAERRRLDRQPRSARLLGDPLRLHLGRGEQRLGLRRPDRQHALVQPDARRRDADRPLPHHRPGAGHRRLARREEDASRPRPARSRPTAGSSSACSSASS